MGIWDTGATGTVITPKVVESCGLKQTGMAEVQHADGKTVKPTYMISLYLPNKVVIPQIKVSEGNLGDSGDVLIGMDVISLGDFILTNREGLTWLSFRMPSIQHIDLVKYKPNPNHGCACGSGKRYGNCCGKKGGKP